MECYYDRQDEERMTASGNVRRLPYEAAGEVAHYDFVNNAALIPEVLEDFKPFAEQRGVRTFYRLLRFLNGPRSVFETTDCLLKPPCSNPTPRLGGGASRQVIGRLMLVYRDHTENLNEEAMQALRISFQQEVSAIRQGWEMGCIGTALYWAWFSSILPEPCEEVTGWELVLRFWAWGENDTECFDNFGTLMQGVGVAMCRVQDRYKQWIAGGRPKLFGA